MGWRLVGNEATAKENLLFSSKWGCTGIVKTGSVVEYVEKKDGIEIILSDNQKSRPLDQFEAMNEDQKNKTFKVTIFDNNYMLSAADFKSLFEEK